MGYTLEIRVGEQKRTDREILDQLEAAERGEEVEDIHVLNIEDEAAVPRILSAVNLELLRTISEKEPSSIRETAAFVDRDVKEVHRNLTELDTLNLIEFEQEGRSKRPIVPFDEMKLDIDLSGDHDSGRNHTVA